MSAQEALLANERLLMLEKEVRIALQDIEIAENRNIFLEASLASTEEEKSETIEYNSQLETQISKLVALKSVFSSNGDLARLTYLIGLQNTLEKEEKKKIKEIEADLIDLNNRMGIINCDAQVNTAAKYAEVHDTHSQVRV